jgi:diguanylate cyclase (GGDEF)-like protein/PAS domain S-box-containing protein
MRGGATGTKGQPRLVSAACRVHNELKHQVEGLISGSQRWFEQDAAGAPVLGEGILQDITERKQLAQALHRSEAQFGAIFDNVLDGIALVDIETRRFLVANRSFYRMLGYAQDEITALRIDDVHPPEALPYVLKQFERRVAGELGVATDIPLKRRDGSIFFADFNSTAVTIDGKRYVLGIMRDATTRKEAAADQARLAAIVESSIDAIISKTLDGTITSWNAAAEDMYGYRADEILGRNIKLIVPEERHTELDEVFKRLARGETIRRFVTERVRKDGTRMAIVTSISPILDSTGNVIEAASICHDIAEHKQAEDERRQTKAFLDTVIEHVPVAVIVKDAPSPAHDAGNCRITLINRAGEELYGVSRDKIIGKTNREFYPNEIAEFVCAHDANALQSDKPVLIQDYVLETPGHGSRIVTAKKVVIRNDKGTPQHILGVIEDVTERKRTEQRIMHMAHYDALTKLPNRATFNDTIDATLDHAATAGKRFAVLSMDLDRFKEANDTYGHLIGDALLREVARRLQAAAGAAFLARVGGDEFMAIVTDRPQPEAAAALAQRLLATIVDDFNVEDHPLKLGMSVGIAIYPIDGADSKTLITNADAALYRAKAEARGEALFFESEMSARLRERRALQEDLRGAIDRRELLLHYQPQKKMSGETIGFDALVRWQCQKRGLVSPGTFIPVAEDSSLIISLGDWVLREACREAASWPEPLSIAVNMSPIQFRNGDLPRRVHSILLETGLAPARLELEITESVMVNDFPRAISILNQLKSLGVRIAMDDFGTGYSSLSYLHSFRCDKIKIDRIFICDLKENYHSRSIVRAVIGLGRSLDLPIIAEGVETEAQHSFLKHEGCDEVQGYLTGRPLPIAHYAELVRRQAFAQQNQAVAGY